MLIERKEREQRSRIVHHYEFKYSVAWFLVFGGVCKGHLPVPSCQFDLCSRNKIGTLHYCLQVPITVAYKIFYSLHNSLFRHCTSLPQRDMGRQARLLLCASFCYEVIASWPGTRWSVDKQSPIFFLLSKKRDMHAFDTFPFLSDLAPLSSIGRSIHLPEPYRFA